MKISIIVPFYNEEENVEAVLQEIRDTNPDAEIIAVNDGSSDRTGTILDTIPNITAIHLPKNLGQSAALYTGLLQATTDICVMLDGDGQNDPADIPTLVKEMANADVVCGYRKTRRDSFSRRLASRTANAIRSFLLADGIRDTGCSLKAMRREDVRHLFPFNGLHRFLPAVLKNAGLSIREIPVNHRPRTAGVSKYTIAGRAWRGIHDLIGVSWFLKRQILWPKRFPKS